MTETYMRATDVMIIAFSLVSKYAWDEVEGWRRRWVSQPHHFPLRPFD
jgi:hypothetical protein